MSNSDGRPSSSSPASPHRDQNERADHKWIDRLRASLGFKTHNSMRHDLEEVLEETDGAVVENGFSPEERSLLRNILDLREMRVDDLMVPRADIVAIQREISLGSVIETFEQAGHTRLVVYDDALDDPIGMVHIKDIIAFLLADAKKGRGRRKAKTDIPLNFANIDLSMPLHMTKLVRPILFVPPSMPAMDLLARMQASRSPMALVVDEYGGTDGLVTVKDVVSAIVGEIEDEHEEDEGPLLTPLNDGIYLAEARASLEEVQEALGESFALDETITDEVDTIGGLLISLAGHVPVRGQVVPGPGNFEFEVVDADPRRVKRVKIVPRKLPAELDIIPAQRKMIGTNTSASLPEPISDKDTEPKPTRAGQE